MYTCKNLELDIAAIQTAAVRNESFTSVHKTRNLAPIFCYCLIRRTRRSEAKSCFPGTGETLPCKFLGEEHAKNKRENNFFQRNYPQNEAENSARPKAIGGNPVMTTREPGNGRFSGAGTRPSSRLCV